MSCEFKKPITSQEMFNAVTSIEEITKLYYLQGFGFVVGLEGGVTLTATLTKVSDDTTTQKFDLEDGFYAPFSVSERERQAFTAFEIAFSEWKKRGYKDELLAPISLDHVKRMDTYADSFDKWH
jgi:hypothetical protein